MPPKKRGSIGIVSTKAKNQRLIRAAETAYEYQNRIQQQRLSQAESRETESDQEYEARLARQRLRQPQSRGAETEEQYEARIARQRLSQAESRVAETEEQYEARIARQRLCQAESRVAETEEQYEARLAHQRLRQAELRGAETEEQYEARLTQQRLRQAESLDSESTEERALRLEYDRSNKNRTNETRNHLGLHMEAFRYNPSTDYSTNPKVSVGKMDLVCQYCQARKFRGEPPGMCCSNGKVILHPLRNPPEPLLSYMSGTTSDSKHFLQNIRKYNSCFQMTSFGTSSSFETTGLGFMPTFKIQGQIYHRIGSILPSPNEEPKFLQIYFVGDEDLQAIQRSAVIPETRNNIILDLQRLFHQHNHLVKLFKTALDRMPSDDYKIVIRADKTPAGEHERRFNAPTINDVAIIIVGEDCDKRDIVIHRRGQPLQRIAETHRSYDALQYPVIFWEGEDGYHFNLRQTNPGQRKISANDFYAYRIMIRSEPNHILQCRQLFHQFIVDMYAKIESERLLYIRLNQKKLRADEYIHLRDAVASDGNVSDIGQMVILPATFTGSPRHMHEYAQDAMSYVRAYGRPDLFITFTCNPTWIEIKEELMEGQSPTDRHDLTARVFKQKLIKLMNVLTKCHIYGETRCWMYSIEWQKRGLPHAHILVWLKNKLHPSQIDDVISAEIPDPEGDPILFEIIKKNMIHGPCGLLNPKSPCMKENICTKKYPRKLIPETQTGNDGYPLYRRRKPGQGGYTAVIQLKTNNQPRQIEVDNSWVVPYSPLLSKMFQAHINVEYCNSVKSIKYICKYVNKGSDMAVIQLENGKSSDEIFQYQMGRYISSNEAVWRILKFPIHERYPPVVHLSVHLENGQRVYFRAENAQEVAARPPDTTLTAFFKLCQEDLFAKTLLYSEVPKYYTWDKNNKRFCKRKQGSLVPGFDGRASDALGRVYTVHPSNSECYYLRLLLHSVRGPKSFHDLKIVDGVLCETFREACRMHGLLEDDENWDLTLSEASLTCFPSQLRSLFSVILTTCNPSNPGLLWEKYKENLSEDILRTHRRNSGMEDLNFSPDIFNESLLLLEENTLSINGKTLFQLGLPAPVKMCNANNDRDFLQERCYDIEKLKMFVESKKPLLVEGQSLAYNEILELVNSGNGGIYFLDAPGGTGKTFLINLLLAEIRSQNEIAVAIASSGIAATLLDGGRTAHSTLKLPLNLALSESPVCNITKGTGKAKVLEQCKIIIWDECTMAHKKALEALDRTLRDLRRKKDTVMGGAVVLLAGDFRQTLPVIQRSTPADELHACLKASYLWRQVQIRALSTNMRVHLLNDTNAHRFASQLLQLGDGKVPIESTGLISFPENFCIMANSIQEVVDKVYPDISINFVNHEWLCERAILAPKNDCVNRLNSEIQGRLPGVSTTYKSFDTVMDTEQAVYYPTEFLNSLEPPGMPPHQLELKIGTPIILLRNINPPKLCNGTRLSVKSLLPNVIEATIITGFAKGETVYVPRIPLIPSDMPFDFKRVQFPVRVAFAMTINKAQGQSLRVAGINLESPCFSHGQLYVACSRVGSPENLIIYAPEGKTKNIVYPKALE